MMYAKHFGHLLAAFLLSCGCFAGDISLEQVLIEGEGWDIGKAVVYLSSNWARYITGHLMIVDGGCSLSARARG